MAKFQGIGQLVGYRTYEKKNKETGGMTSQHEYFVLLGSKDENGLLDDCALVTIRETEQKLKPLKGGMPVKFDVENREFYDSDSKRTVTSLSYSNIAGV